MVSWQCPARNSHVIPNEKREARASLPTVLGKHEETVTMILCFDSTSFGQLTRQQKLTDFQSFVGLLCSIPKFTQVVYCPRARANYDERCQAGEVQQCDLIARFSELRPCGSDCQ